VVEVSHVILGQTSKDAPALASLDSVLYLAWSGEGNEKLNVATSTDGGQTFGDPLISQQTSPASPVLCVRDRQPFIAWTGTDNNKLNVAEVTDL
jgi:hypothetical protein